VHAPSVAAIVARLPVTRGCAVVHDGDDTIVAVAPDAVRVANGEDAFTALRELDRGGFWCGFLAYDLGRSVERVETRVGDGLGIPDLAFARFDTRLRLRGRDVIVEGDGPSRGLLVAAVEAAATEGEVRPARTQAAPHGWTSSLDRHAHEAAVAVVHAHLEAGDCYQVNLTRRLRASVADPVAMFGALAGADVGQHAALLTFGAALPDLAIVSVTPETFLRRDGAHVRTRPIKGTGHDAQRLSRSAKDRAENVMIVDLARNDVGRVCEFGTVQVPALCAVEEYADLFHLVSTVDGRLRAGVGLADLVRATFPPASVTGAPKPRVLQIIEDLEPVRRGVYCGALGWIDGDRSRAALDVAIRTFTITSTGTYFGVGGGIVADSRADAEWAETELKATRLLDTVAARLDSPVGA
jgi:para-aminobenzoate synthetase component 1